MVYTDEGVRAGLAPVPKLPRAAGVVRLGALRNPLAIAVAALILAGCASPFPAPIVHRSPAKRPAPGAQSGPPPLVTQPQAPGATSPDSGPIVQTAPSRSASVESRPLGGQAGAAQPISPSAGGARTSAIRTEPSAAKRPYSEELLAQLKKQAPADAAAAPASPAASPAKTLAAQSPQAGAASSRGFVWPASGQVIQGFSGTRSTGLAIAGKAGDPVVAAADGRVIFSGRGPRGYGNLVIVKHDSDTLSVYGHNRSLLVKEGASVKRGQRIAEIGDTDADRPQLHFEIRKDSKPVDPTEFLPPR